MVDLFLLLISAASTSNRTVPCCGHSLYAVFSSLSVVIFPKIVVTLLCLWEEMSSESASAAILMRSPNTCFKDESSLKGKFNN